MTMRRMLSAALAALLFVGLVGCGQPEPSSSAGPSKPSAPTATATAEATASTAEAVGTATGHTPGTSPAGTAKAPTKAPPVKNTTAKATATAAPARLLSGNLNLTPKPLSGDRSAELLKNPDRGFRLEAYYNVLKGNAYPTNGTDARDFLDEMLFDYAEDSPQLSQLFFYITEYYNRDFDDEFFTKMDGFFQYIRGKKIRLLIRFVYQWDENDNVRGPTAAQILRHIAQLKPLIAKYQDVIHCWQAGFIGRWGEWHNSVVPMSDQDKANVLTALVDNSPAGMFIETRMVEYRDTVPDSDPRKALIGYHDDYLTGQPNKWSCGLVPGESDYQRMIDQSANLLVDGEMPWGSDKMMGEKFNGLDMAKYLSQRHYTSMSLIHNYRDAGPCTMTYWQDQYVSAATLQANGLRYTPAWFQKADGSTQKKTIFDYIQQHLGYVLGVTKAAATSSASSVQANVTFENYGFAAPHAMKSLELVLLDESGKVVAAKDGGKMAAFQPGKAIEVKATFAVPNAKARYRLGVRFVNSAGTGARLANDCGFQGNVNVLGYVR